jgi:hypothetical protein
MTSLANDTDQIRQDFINVSYPIDNTTIIVPTNLHQANHSWKHDDDVRDRVFRRGGEIQTLDNAR